MSIIGHLRQATIVLACLCTQAVLAGEAPRVKFETTQGSFTVELNPEKAPKSVANFLKYVEDKHYDGTVFHRVIPGFVVQGGGFTKDMQQKPVRAPIELEAKNGLRNVTGSIAMARTSDPNSATSQFYINVADNGMLDYPSPDGNGYAVFGKVVDGMSTVTKITRVRTGNVAGMGDVPLQPIIITSASVVAAAPAGKK
ncbi:peptidylprolyl isomerase [Uliginosibacterium sediminicola]|uniref:Peptidyl-prolyl cis-trans isomerase n=1 Tax=Uliginosibacterium sediminicola TaxID=2024550 RepID=A0ABU9Z028_9RHOO